VLRRFLVGFLGVAAALMLATAVWFAATKPIGSPGLVWGDSVYRSKEEFKLYLKDRGLSYKTWLRRNPGIAPWEPGERVGVSKQLERTWDWKRDLLLALNAAMLATIAAAVVARTTHETRWRDEGSFFASRADTDGGRPTLSRVIGGFAKGLTYIRKGAQEITKLTFDQARQHRTVLTPSALGAGLAFACGWLIARLLS
jgi:hypothetical protein